MCMGRADESRFYYGNTVYVILLWCMWQKPENAVNRFCTLIHCLILETDHQHKCQLFYYKLS